RAPGMSFLWTFVPAGIARTRTIPATAPTSEKLAPRERASFEDRDTLPEYRMGFSTSFRLSHATTADPAIRPSDFLTPSSPSWASPSTRNDQCQRYRE